jgi:protein SCO1/2
VSHRAALLALVCAVSMSRAQSPPSEARLDPGLPPALAGIGIEQRLDRPIPLDLAFTDERGASVRLGDYFGERPVILVPAYYTCPMLCSQVLRGVAASLAAVGLEIGRDFEVVTVSFDPRDTSASAAASKRGVLERYRRPGAERGWHFLTGAEEASRALFDAAGFAYRWDPRTGQYAHASGIMLLTPDGRLARYFFGIEYAPRDLRLGLVEASEGRIGSPADRLFLFCFAYDPATGRYGATVMTVLRLAAILTVVGLALLIFVLGRRFPRLSAPQGTRG